MSETYPGNYGAAIMLEDPSGGETETEEPGTQTVHMPFEPQTAEAEALRGAFSFLFMLITFYSELLEQDALIADGAESQGAGLH